VWSCTSIQPVDPTDARVLPGSFEPPAGLDPAQRVLSGFAAAPYRHHVILRIQGTTEQIRAVLPASIASVEDSPSPVGADRETARWLRVELRAERLDWLPTVLASLAGPLLSASWTPFVASDATSPDRGDVACHWQRGDRFAKVLLICFYAHHY
jgi:hypothetical protein